MKNESIFTATDQRERELIWDALVEYKKLGILSDSEMLVDGMIERVSRTFSWVRES
jgi:hypothetical protein